VVDVRRVNVVVVEAGEEAARVVDVEVTTAVGACVVDGGTVVNGGMVVVVGRAGTAPASDGSDPEHAAIDNSPIDNSIASPSTRPAFTPGLLARRFSK